MDDISIKNNNGLGYIMEDKVLTNFLVEDCVEFVYKEGIIAGLKLDPIIEKLLLQVWKGKSDIEYLQECIGQLDEKTRNSIGLK